MYVRVVWLGPVTVTSAGLLACEHNVPNTVPGLTAEIEGYARFRRCCAASSDSSAVDSAAKRLDRWAQAVLARSPWRSAVLSARGLAIGPFNKPFVRRVTTDEAGLLALERTVCPARIVA